MRNLKVSLKMIILQICMIIALISAGFMAMYFLNQEKNASTSVLEQTIRTDYDENVKEQVTSVISLLNEIYQKYESGEYTKDQAKTLAADLVRNLSYQEGGYFWIDTYDGDNVVYLGKDTEGTNRLNIKDTNGFEMLKEIIRVAQEPEGGYTDYTFPKAEGTDSYPKRSYSKAFEPFHWVVGTGNYTDYIDEIVQTQTETMTATIDKQVTLLMVILIAIACIIFIISWVISRDITHSLKEAIQFFEVMASGDFTKSLSKRLKNREDDIGKLGKKMDEMREQLRRLIQEIQQSETMLNLVVNEIKENVVKQDESIENVSATTQELAASMEETSATAESINGMSEQIGSASKNIAERAQDGARQASMIYDRARNAKDKTKQQRENSASVQKEIRESLEQALLDVKVVDRIGVLSTSIMDITNQTNLLALNASIEAARAGEAGRGFAVVAEEIGNLAEQSKDAVAKIQEVTQKVTSSVLNLSGDSQRLLEFINVDVSKSFDEFDKIAEAYNKDAVDLDGLISDFSATSQELLASIEGVLTSIDAISTATNEGAIGITDIAQRASDVLDMSGIIDQSVRKCVETTDVLHRNVERFKV
ncbi:MAG: methyl-accepting chemotaxis protein [Velocimicrobium sp.]